MYVTPLVSALLYFLQIVIADESHYMKNPQAKRTNASIPLFQVIIVVNLLSLKL